MDQSNRSCLRIGLLWRGDRFASVPAPGKTRLGRIFEELDRLDVHAEAVVYAEEANAEVREQLLALDGVLAWLDPTSQPASRRVSSVRRFGWQPAPKDARGS